MTEVPQNNKHTGAAYLLGLLAVIGFVLSVYSLYTHVLVTHGWLTAPSACNINSSFNCDAVNASPYAELFGVPIASYGVAFYGLLLVAAATCIAVGTVAVSFWQALTLVGLASVVASLALFSISTFLIGTWCIVCIAMYLVNIAVLVLAWKKAPAQSFGARIGAGVSAGLSLPAFIFGLGRFQTSPHKFSGLMSGVIGALLASGALLGSSGAMVDYARPRHDLPPLPEVNAHLERTMKQWQETLPEPRVQIERFASDLPNSKGPRSAPVRIVEFFDYECPACRFFHGTIEKVLARYGDRVVVVHQDFPLDQSCNPMIQRRMHQHACYAAEVAHCAGEQGAYWRVSDFLLTSPILENHAPEAEASKREDLDRGLAALGLDMTGLRDCVTAGRYKNRIKASIDLAVATELESTPSIFINERKVSEPDEESIIKIIDSILGG